MVRVPYQGACTLQVWGLCDLPFENFSPALVFVRVHAAARGTCHVARSATWRMPSSCWCFGASNGLGPVRIRPSVRPLLTKALRPPRRCVLLGLNRWCCHLARKVSTWPIEFNFDMHIKKLPIWYLRLYSMAVIKRRSDVLYRSNILITPFSMRFFTGRYSFLFF